MRGSGRRSWQLTRKVSLGYTPLSQQQGLLLDMGLGHSVQVGMEYRLARLRHTVILVASQITVWAKDI